MEVPFGYKEDDTSSGSSGGSSGRHHFKSKKEESPPPGFQLPENHHYGAGVLLPAFSPAHPTFDSQLSANGAASAGTAAATSSPSSSKRSGRRSVQKRVLSVPAVEADGARAKGCGEAAPASDSSAWRKYGQKPIKGSPYPRGYYRCSSSKGCPARKQVERSRVDPRMLVVTYSGEHNHSWPLPKNNHNHHQRPCRWSCHQRSPQSSPPEQRPGASLINGPAVISSSPASVDLEEKSFAPDLLIEDSSLAAMASCEFGWFSNVPASSPPFLGCPMMRMVDIEDAVDLGGDDNAGDDESSLFAGLGELPECAMVFRSLRMQMAAPEDPLAVAAAPCGSTTS